MIYVTHDQIEAMTLADKIVVLRDGRIEQVGKPLELYARPANQFVAGFIGSPKMNFLAAKVAGYSERGLDAVLEDGSWVVGACSERPVAGTALTVGIRPEHLQVVPVLQGVLRAEVVVAERLGGETYFHVRIAGKSGIARVIGDSAVAVGETVGLTFDPAHLHFFIPDARRLT